MFRQGVCRLDYSLLSDFQYLLLKRVEFEVRLLCTTIQQSVPEVHDANVCAIRGNDVAELTSATREFLHMLVDIYQIRLPNMSVTIRYIFDNIDGRCIKGTSLVMKGGSGVRRVVTLLELKKISAESQAHDEMLHCCLAALAPGRKHRCVSTSFYLLNKPVFSICCILCS